MDLLIASQQGLPLVYRLRPTWPEGLVAHAFATAQGVLVADIGWGGDSTGLLPGGHPFHALEGTVTPDGPPWRIGQARFRLLEDGDALAAEWNAYQRFLDTPAGQQQSRAACAAVLKRLGYAIQGD
jgi:hypothetical protein